MPENSGQTGSYIAFTFIFLLFSFALWQGIRKSADNLIAEDIRNLQEQCEELPSNNPEIYRFKCENDRSPTIIHFPKEN